MAKTGFDFFLFKIVKFNQVNDVWKECERGVG